MKKIIAIAAIVAAALLTASCNKKSPFTSYEISSITSVSAFATWTYNVTDITGVQYSYTLEKTQAAAENVANIKIAQDAYDIDHAHLELTGLQPSTTYYTVGFLKVGSTLYSSRTVRFTTLSL